MGLLYLDGRVKNDGKDEDSNMMHGFELIKESALKGDVDALTDVGYYY